LVLDSADTLVFSPMRSPSTIIVGAGVFGAAAATALRRRGHEVTLIDAGPVPAPLAASTDISKVLRMEYGPDETYMALMEEAFDGWRRWSAAWTAAGDDDVYHETGVLMVCREPMAPGGFERDSWDMLRRRGHEPERMDAESLARRFPAWSTRAYVDGFFHRLGGWAESGRVVGRLLAAARQAGVRVLEERRIEALIEERSRVVGVRDDRGNLLRGDHVVVAAGAWTGTLLGFRHEIRSTGHPVLHFRPRDPARFAPERFPVFTADIARTGLYGFPVNRDGVVKVALHDEGLLMDPDAPRAVTPRHETRIRELLATTIPALADADIVYRRLCLYADTQDGDFWIARDPEREGLTVASGGSGHGFKFGPVLGGIIADVVEGVEHPLASKFRWRSEVKRARGAEAARHHGT
jgi:glycine/D-amino acid oxidase-like deaminating enzyme